MDALKYADMYMAIYRYVDMEIWIYRDIEMLRY